jgi:predicted MFS family arabinose efflux permease
MIPRAVAAWSSANQIAVICGPALGGLIYTVSPVLVATLCLVFFSTSITLISLVQSRGPAPGREPPTFASVLAGFEYIRSQRRLLGVITLDFFVVLLGGVTALLPIFARDILSVGPVGLGLLRSAPAVGALITTIVLSRWPVERHIGHKMFAVVAIYGVTTIAFALSGYFPLSLLALALLGAFDAVSVVIRFSLVQIETPDDKRGRVSAINYLFVGSSNTFGEFESGTVAAWLGAVPSVLIGGVGSLLVAGIWMLLFPDLRRIDRFEPADKRLTET